MKLTVYCSDNRNFTFATDNQTEIDEFRQIYDAFVSGTVRRANIRASDGSIGLNFEHVVSMRWIN